MQRQVEEGRDEDGRQDRVEGHQRRSLHHEVEVQHHPECGEQEQLIDLEEPQEDHARQRLPARHPIAPQQVQRHRALADLLIDERQHISARPDRQDVPQAQIRRIEPPHHPPCGMRVHQEEEHRVRDHDGEPQRPVRTPEELDQVADRRQAVAGRRRPDTGIDQVKAPQREQPGRCSEEIPAHPAPSGGSPPHQSSWESTSHRRSRWVVDAVRLGGQRSAATVAGRYQPSAKPIGGRRGQAGRRAL